MACEFLLKPGGLSPYAALPNVNILLHLFKQFPPGSDSDCSSESEELRC